MGNERRQRRSERKVKWLGSGVKWNGMGKKAVSRGRYVWRWSRSGQVGRGEKQVEKEVENGARNGLGKKLDQIWRKGMDFEAE